MASNLWSVPLGQLRTPLPRVLMLPKLPRD
jgi:hypothetical protein